jgi:hypothetical protein
MYYWAGMPLGHTAARSLAADQRRAVLRHRLAVWFAACSAWLLGLVRPRLPALLVVLALNGAVAYSCPRCGTTCTITSGGGSRRS